MHAGSGEKADEDAIEFVEEDDDGAVYEYYYEYYYETEEEQEEQEVDVGKDAIRINKPKGRNKR